MKAIIENRVKALNDSMVNVGKHTDEVVKWLDDRSTKKDIDKNF